MLKNKISKLKAIIVMYHGGNPINAENFWKLKKKLNCFIIEDSCHALGSEYKFKKNTIKLVVANIRYFYFFTTSIKIDNNRRRWSHYNKLL